MPNFDLKRQKLFFIFTFVVFILIYVISRSYDSNLQNFVYRIIHNYRNYSNVVENFSTTTNDDDWKKCTQQNLSTSTPIDLSNPPIDDPVWIPMSNRRIILKSAYVDLSYSSKLKILALKHGQENGRVECIFYGKYFQNSTSITNIVEATYDLIRNYGWGYDKCWYWYQELYIYCPLPPILAKLALFRPNEVLIIASDSDHDSKSQLSPRLKIDYVSKSKYELSMCVAPLFNYFDERRLIFFIEYYLYHGADCFVFYNFSSSQSIVDVLTEYKKLGLVEIVQWTKLPKLSNERDEPEVWYNAQVLSINDCRWRLRSRSKFTAHVDLDEFILPSNNRTILELLREIDRPKIGAFVFTFFYAYVNWPPPYNNDESKQKSFREIFDFHRLIVSRPADIVYNVQRTKLIVKPTAIKKQFVHWVRTFWDNYEKYDIPTKMALNYHLRPYPEGSEPIFGNDTLFRHRLQKIFNFTGF